MPKKSPDAPAKPAKGAAAQNAKTATNEAERHKAGKTANKPAKTKG